MVRFPLTALARDSSAMLPQLLIPVGAGVASAVFFILPLKGGMLAPLCVVIAPMPLMIVTIGWGMRAGAIASACGAALIAGILSFWLAFGYAASVAAPALALVYAAHRSPLAGAPERGPQYNLPQILAAMVGLTTLVQWFALLMIGSEYASFDAAVEAAATRILPLVTLLMERANGVFAGSTPMDIAMMMVLFAAPVMAVWGVFNLALNLWLSARIAQVSGRLSWSWPDIPAGFGLPRAAAPVLALAVGLTFMAGPMRIFAGTLVGALGAALALQGLAIVHYLSRGVGVRHGLLAGLYSATLLIFPWPLLFAAGLGLSEFFLSLRRSKKASAPGEKTSS